MPEVTSYRLDDHDRRIKLVEESCGRVSVLEERVHTLSDEVRAMKRALWGLVFSVMGGMILFFFSIATGLIG
jgi:hypothetical protein